MTCDHEWDTPDNPILKTCVNCHTTVSPLMAFMFQHEGDE